MQWALTSIPSEKELHYIFSRFGCHHLEATASNCNIYKRSSHNRGNKLCKWAVSWRSSTLQKNLQTLEGTVVYPYCNPCEKKNAHTGTLGGLGEGGILPSLALLSASPHFQMGSNGVQFCTPQYQSNINRFPVIWAYFRVSWIPSKSNNYRTTTFTTQEKKYWWRHPKNHL